MTPDKVPEFPLHILYLQEGKQLTLGSEVALCQDLEWHDNLDPQDAAEARVTDAKGRPVKLILKFLQIQLLELSGEPAAEEDIELIRTWPEL